MSRLEDVGVNDGWRCWLCDEQVDPTMSVNDARGPSVDSCTTDAKNKKAKSQERLAHRACNTRKGAVAPIVEWPDRLFVFEPAPIFASVERLGNKRGRELMARCPTRADAQEAAAWLTDRISRLRPDLTVTTDIEPGGGQFLVILRT